MPQDDFQQARERYEEATEAMRENHQRMVEDLRFSNPADPQQWDPRTVTDRTGRPTLTLDQTNQFIQQVVNDGRQSPPSIQVVPVDSGADIAVANSLNGNMRHIEYQSRAPTHFATSLEYSARVGLGWLVVRPVVCDAMRNYQEPRIFGCQDPLAARIDPDAEEFDGSDAMFGFLETTYSEAKYKRKWPKAPISSFGGSETAGWISEKGIRVAEYWSVRETKKNTITIQPAGGGEPYPVTEEQYWGEAKKLGYRPLVVGEPYMSTHREVKWYKMNGEDFLPGEDGSPDRIFPSSWIGLVPVYGHMMVVDGKRVVCGLTRRLMDGQRFHNYQMSSLAETLLSQPKAPIMVPARGIEGNIAQHWAALNTGNPGFLPYVDIDADGNPVAPPTRIAPPPFPAAAAQGAQLGVQEMQAAVGMHKSNLGQQSNAVSGRAKMADKLEGDTATFHYLDNRSRSIEQVGRICVDMTTRLIDTERTLRILGQDGKVSFLKVDPEQAEAAKKDARGKLLSANIGVGKYDVRVKVGPAHTTMREELNDRLAQLGQANPQLAAALAPLMVKLADLPEADTVARVCLSLLPPQVQAAYNEDDTDADLPPQIKMQMQQLTQGMQQATQLIQQLTQELNLAQDKNAQKAAQEEAEQGVKTLELEVRAAENDTARFVAETERVQAEADRMRAEAELNASLLGEDPEVREATVQAPQQLEALLQAMGGLFDAFQAQQEAAAEVLERQEQTAGAVEALTDLVARPRVATIEMDEDGFPVRAVSTVEA